MCDTTRVAVNQPDQTKTKDCPYNHDCKNCPLSNQHSNLSQQTKK
jgi:hypothetical protein